MSERKITCDWAPKAGAFRRGLNVVTEGIALRRPSKPETLVTSKPVSREIRVWADPLEPGWVRINDVSVKMFVSGDRLVARSIPAYKFEAIVPSADAEPIGVATAGGGDAEVAVEPEAPKRVQVDWEEAESIGPVLGMSLRAETYMGMPDGVEIRVHDLPGVVPARGTQGALVSFTGPAGFFGRDLLVQVNGVWLTAMPLTFGIGNPHPTGGQTFLCYVLQGEGDRLMSTLPIGHPALSDTPPAWSQHRAALRGGGAETLARRLRQLRQAASPLWGSYNYFASKPAGDVWKSEPTPTTYGEVAARLEAALAEKMAEVRDAEAKIK